MGAWKEEFIERGHPHGHNYYWLTGYYSNFEPDAEDTDEWALKNKYVAVVPLRIDQTDYKAMDKLKSFATL